MMQGKSLASNTAKARAFAEQRRPNQRVGFLPASCSDKTNALVFFLQSAATKPTRWFPSCKVQRQNQRVGFLPAKCSGKTNALVLHSASRGDLRVC
jgi:hypothetical protein